METTPPRLTYGFIEVNTPDFAPASLLFNQFGGHPSPGRSGASRQQSVAARTPRDKKDGAGAGHAASMHLAPTIFHETWWLDIAGQGRCREAVVSSGGTVVGRLPYFHKTRGRWHAELIMPMLTHALGPALTPDVSKNASARVMRPFSITSDLIAQLPKASHVDFLLHRGIKDTLAFQAAGFSTGVNFTIEIAPDTPEALWRQLRDKTRNIIRRAQERLTVVDLADPRQFVDFYQENLRDRDLRNYYERDICEQLVTACLRRGVGRTWAAVEPAGAVQAAIFTIWDHEIEYYYLSTRRLGSMNGAISLLIWNAMQHASENGLIFDMDRVDGANILLVSGFGGTVTPRYMVWRTTPAYRTAKYVAGLLNPASVSLRDVGFGTPRRQ